MIDLMFQAFSVESSLSVVYEYMNNRMKRFEKWDPNPVRKCPGL